MACPTFEELLDEQLASLRASLLRKHAFEVRRSTCSRSQDDFNLMISDESFHRFDDGVPWERSRSDVHIGTAEDLNDPIPSEFEDLPPWTRFVVKLLEQGKEEETESVSLNSNKGALKMRDTWKVSLHDGAQQTGRSAYQVSILSKNMSLKINDAVTDDSCLQRFVCGPHSTPQLAWSMLACVFILWYVITMPLEMFNVSWLMQVLDVAGIVTFAFWTLDIPLHFIFGIQLEGTLELRPKKLAQIYLRSWFALDVLVVLIDIFVFILEAVLTNGMEGSMIRSARYLRILRLLRLARLLRVIKLTRELTLLANRFLSTHAFMVMKIVAGLGMMIAMNHLVACVWYGLASMRAEDDNWVASMGLERAGFGTSYAASMHWALTQFTPATTNIAPVSGLERWFALLIVLLAMGVFSSFIGSISATVSSLRSARSEQAQKQSKLLQFFIERDLSVDLYMKVQEALRREGAFRMRSAEDEVEMIQGIPERFKIQLHEEMYASTLAKCHFWPERQLQEDEQFFIRLLCHQCLSEAAAAPGQDVFLPGNDCAQAYVMQTGLMSYHGKENFEQNCSAEMNSCLCITALWADWHTRGRFAAAHGLCYFVTIDAEGFCTSSLNYGGSIYAHLQIFGILLVGHVEALDEEDLLMTDLVDESVMAELRVRAQQYCAFAGDLKKKRYKTTIFQGFKPDPQDSWALSSMVRSKQNSEASAS